MVSAALVALMVPGLGMEAQQPTPPVSSFTVTSRLVVVDVVVTDKNGKPVTNLGKDKFVVYEEGVQQKIKDFDPPSGHMMPAGSATKAVVNSVADLPKIGTAPVNVLVFDELNTPFLQLAYARQQMVKYLMAQPEVLPVPTLFVAAGNTKMAVLHDYTQSRAELLESVKKHTADVDFTAMIAQRRWHGGDAGCALTDCRVTARSSGTQKRNLDWEGLQQCDGPERPESGRS